MGTTIRQGGIIQAGLWFLLLLGIGLLFLIMLPACGLGIAGLGAPWLTFCRAPQAAAIDPAVAVLAERERALQDEIAALERALLQRPVCPVPPAQPAMAVPPRKPEPLQLADIPEEDWRNRNLGLLEGCWQLDARLAFRREGTDIIDHTTGWRMCFDGEGHGEEVMSFEGGYECRVDLESRFRDDGRLEIVGAGAYDCGGAPFTPYSQTKTCERLNDREALCDWLGRRPDGSIGADGRNTFRRSA